MARLLYLSILLTLAVLHGFSQVPQKIAYQAVVRNASGVAIASTDVELRVILLSGSIEGTPVYKELHTLTTSPLGVVSFNIGDGTPELGSIAEVPWEEGIFIVAEMAIDGGSFVEMGRSQVVSVPYALKAGGLAKGAVEIKPAAGHNPDEPIFVVRNSNNQIVYAVYEDGVRFNIGNSSKSSRGGFAVGSLVDQTKAGKELNYLTIQPDSVRFNLVHTSKSNRGGFAIGGLVDQTKNGVTQVDYMSLRPDNIRFAIDESTTTKSNRGGFAIGGLVDQTKTFSNYFLVNRDCTFVANTLAATGDVLVSGNIFTGGTVGTLPTPPITDIEGNVYPTVRIGNQIWMAQNLRVTRYNDGTPIPISAELNSVMPYFTPVDSFQNPLTDSRWGLLYAMQFIDNNNICPTGWRLPTFNDWNFLIQNSGGFNYAGASLKEQNMWLDPVYYPANGFNARPAGALDLYDNEGTWDYSYNGYKMATAFWSQPEEIEGMYGSKALRIFSSDQMYEPFQMVSFEQIPYNVVALSIRCIKNEETPAVGK